MILTKQNIPGIDLDKIIDDHIRSGDTGGLLLIYPTNRKVRNLKKEIISLMPKKSAAGLNIETLGTISSKLLRQSRQFNLLSEAAATVFIKQSAAKQKLKYFSNYKNEIPVGTLDRIKNVISEYKKNGITPAVLIREAEDLQKSEKLKALDIAAIYESYNSICHSLNSFEIGDVYSFLNSLGSDEIERNFRKLYATVRQIVISGFDQFTNPETEIINYLSDLKDMELYINFDYSLKNKYLFSHLDNIYKKLSGDGFRKIEDRSPSNRNEFGEAVSSKLFATPGSKLNSTFKEQIKIISAFDKEKEITALAKEIKNLILLKNVEPHKICLVFNLIKNYSGIVRDLFSKHGIPYNLSDRKTLSTSPPVTAIVNFLEIAENDYYYKNIFRVLNGGFIDLASVDSSNLFRISAELKIVVGKENWLNSIKEAAYSLNFNNESDQSDLDRKKLKYQKAAEDIMLISGLLEPFEKKQTTNEFRKSLEELIFNSKLPLKLIHDAEPNEENIKAVATFLDTINEIFSLLEEEFGKEAKFGLKYFLDQIRTACGWARFNVKEKPDYGVQVTTLDEIRGLKFDYIFIAGMCDGELPTRYNPEIFFSGSFIKKAIVHQTEERYRFYQILSSWNKGLYLSYPLTDSGRETVVSTFLRDFERLFDSIKLDASEFDNVFTSKEEIQLFAGHEGVEALREIYGEKLKKILPDAEFVENAIKVNTTRTQDPGSDSPFNGIILNSISSGSDPAADELLQKRITELKQRQFSVSQLETFAKCPFKFFIERVLNVEMIEEPTEEIEALEMGRILHEIFYEFYTQVRKSNITLAGCSDAIFKRAEKMLFDLAETIIERSAFKSPVTFLEKEKILGLEGDPKKSILTKFLENERNGGEDYLPQFFEVSFGKIRKEGSDALLSDPEPVIFGDIKLRGKIDRIEINAESNSFNIADYKLSGKKPSSEELQNGLSLQLPLYIHAAGNLLEKKFGKKYAENEMYIYSLKYKAGEFGKKRVSAVRSGKRDSTDTVSLVESTKNYILKYIDSISKGRFNLSSLKDREEKVCRYCGFKSICRIDDILG